MCKLKKHKVANEESILLNLFTLFLPIVLRFALIYRTHFLGYLEGLVVNRIRVLCLVQTLLFYHYPTIKIVSGAQCICNGRSRCAVQAHTIVSRR